MSEKDITWPIGRMIGGSVTVGDDTDSKGNKRTVKTGANIGKPLFMYNFGVAYRKGNEQHWSQTPWGQLMYAAGVEGYPNGETQRPDFAWKVIDGDSTIPNKNQKRPCDQIGYPGHWIVWYSSAAAPKLYDIIGNRVGEPPRALSPGMEILPGYYIQVAGSAKDNKPSESPGIYVNHSLVALAGYAERIQQGPNANEVGFGGALPTGASTVPVGGMPAQVPPAALPGAVTPPPAQQVAVAPNPAILANPAAAGIAPPPPPAVAPPPPPAVAPPPPPPAADPMGAPAGRRMIGAYTYQQLQAANYSDEQMIAQGFMQ